MDNTLKQRLIGASVLVALAAIFVPMLIKGPALEGGADAVSLRAPAAPSGDGMQTRELPLVMPSAPAGGVTGMPTAPQVAEPEAAPAVPAAQAAAGDFAVNYGAYASQGDADRVIASLATAGLTAFAEPAQVAGRQAWRVRIGPFADRASAESARLRAAALRNDVHPAVVVLDGRGGEMAEAAPPAAAPAPVTAPAASAPQQPPRTVQTPAPPVAQPAASRPAPAPAPAPAPRSAPAPAPAPAPAAAPKPAVTAVGWAVQLGAFSNAAEANALRDSMRSAGFSAFVEQVPTDRGPLNRVRVGPVASREAAEQLRAQVGARTGNSGMVRQHP